MANNSKVKVVRYSVWGVRPKALRSVDLEGSGARWAPDSYEGKAAAVARSIARRAGLECGSLRHDSDTADSSIYEVTLGRSIPRRRGGGFSVEGACWFSIPRS
jgi:hypothetical protein